MLENCKMPCKTCDGLNIKNLPLSVPRCSGEQRTACWLRSPKKRSPSSPVIESHPSPGRHFLTACILDPRMLLDHRTTKEVESFHEMKPPSGCLHKQRPGSPYSCPSLRSCLGRVQEQKQLDESGGPAAGSRREKVHFLFLGITRRLT